MQSPSAMPSQGVVLQVPQAMNTGGETTDQKVKRFKRIMRGLGFAELVIGIICCVLGIAILSHAFGVDHLRKSFSYSSNSNRYVSTDRFNIGEGLWCGLWVVVAGSLGIACGKKTVTPCLLNSNLAFSILGAFFSVTLFSTAIPMSVIYADPYKQYNYGVGIQATLAVLGFIAFIICIVSASYCCCAASVLGANGCCGGCCSGCCGGNQAARGGQQVVYVMANPMSSMQTTGVHSSPIMMQTGVQAFPVATVQMPNVQQYSGVSQPQYVGTTSHQHPINPQQIPSTQQQTDQENLATAAAVAKQREAAHPLLETGNTSSPPSYEI